MTSQIKKNIDTITQKITQVASSCGRDPETIRLIAVSKKFPVSVMQEALKYSQSLFGENYIQEAQEKYKILGNTADIHIIGHIQSNKAKIAAEIATMVHTVDSIKLAKNLNATCASLNRNLDILIQVNIGNDEAKFGISPEEAETFAKQLHQFKQLRLKGLMTMPPLTASFEEARVHFKGLHDLAQELAAKNLIPKKDEGQELSMGMSSDYHVAIEEGATLVRVGTAIFGQRAY
jgi:pyridoxal phosphate enzyme (YggS family)